MDFNAIDPLISAGIGLITLWGSTRVVLEASRILLEGVPRGIELNEVVEDIGSAEGVLGVHSLNVWGICHNMHALSARVETDGRYVYRQAQSSGISTKDLPKGTISSILHFRWSAPGARRARVC